MPPLRRLALLLLLIALLPWGAHLRPAAALPAPAEAAVQAALPEVAAQTRLPPCRKGLAGGSYCSADKALPDDPPVAPAAAPGNAGPRTTALALPRGLTPRPGLPPPRLS
ncbi:MAG: hypothetical protein R3D90_14055 [Paracoccaceae bacterium]